MDSKPVTTKRLIGAATQGAGAVGPIGIGRGLLSPTKGPDSATNLRQMMMMRGRSSGSGTPRSRGFGGLKSFTKKMKKRRRRKDLGFSKVPLVLIGFSRY